MKLQDIEGIDELMLKYKFALSELTNKITILLEEYEFNNKTDPIEHTKTRFKTLESAESKLRKKGYEVTMDNLINHVHDMVGIRIICSFLTEVYDVVNIIKSSKQFRITAEKDYIKEPKKSGYRSYHLNVLVRVHLKDKIEYVEAEIQIRTIAMDTWASLDHKLRYKLTNLPDNIEDEMYACSDEMVLLDKRMEKLHHEVLNLEDK